MGRVEAQKQAKRQGLMDAAYELFLRQGTAKTSINDIVEKARVAKGTFYLYFRDKEDILQTLTRRISYRVLSEAYASMDAHRTADFAENVILLMDYVIEYFRRDTLVLRMLERNFSWPYVESEMTKGTDPLFVNLRRDIQSSPSLAGRSESELFRLSFMIISLCGDVCYSSLIEHRPAEIDEMKPVLYDVVRKSLR